MNLTNAEHAAAARELESPGITGSDLETSLRGVCALLGDTTYNAWVEQIRKQSMEELVATYGHDWIRAVLTLQSAGAAT